MIDDLHMWLHEQYPVMSTRRCPLDNLVQERNRRIYPFIKYIHSIFK